MKHIKVKGEAIEEIAIQLKKGKSVKAHRLGIFKIVDSRKRGYSIREGRVIDLKPKKRVLFSPASSLKREIN